MPVTVEFSGVCERVLDFIQNERGYAHTIYQEADYLGVQYAISSSQPLLQRLVGQEFFWLSLWHDAAAGRLFYSVGRVDGRPASVLSGPDDFPLLQKTGWLSGGHISEISDFLGSVLAEGLVDSVDEGLDAGGCYVSRNWSVAAKLFWQRTRLPEEVLLSALEIGRVKSWPSELDPDPEATWWYVLSSRRSGWLGLRAEGQGQFFPHGHCLLLAQKSIGRDQISAGYFVWEATGTHERYFHELPSAVAILDAPLHRIWEVIRLNWQHRLTYPEAQSFVEAGLAYLIHHTDNPLYAFALLYTQLHREPQAPIPTTLDTLFFYPELSNVLAAWADAWYVPLSDRLALVHLLLLEQKAGLPYERLLVFHAAVREEFLQKEKSLVAKVWAEWMFCRHLIWAGDPKQAQTIIEETLEVLPDETLSALLPLDALQPTGKQTGAALKIQGLDLLIAAKGDKNAVEALAAAVEAQPLVAERVERWVAVARKQERARAETLLRCLRPQGLEPAVSEGPDLGLASAPLPDEILRQELPHPATRQKTIKQFFQKWLAQAAHLPPDARTLQDFGTELSPESHPGLQAILENIARVLGLVLPPVYLHNKPEISVYHHPEPLLVIGRPQVEALQTPEWYFALGAALNDLKMGYVQMTLSDLWAGARERSTTALDIFFALLPSVGLLGSTIKYLPDLQKFALHLQRISQTGQALLPVATQALELVSEASSTKETTEKTQELLVISRLMQYSSDRVGLLLAQDLASAVRAIFLTQLGGKDLLAQAQEMGLDAFLAQQNEQGRWVHQELALRLSALFAFYVGEDFPALTALLYPGKS